MGWRSQQAAPVVAWRSSLEQSVAMPVPSEVPGGPSTTASGVALGAPRPRRPGAGAAVPFSRQAARMRLACRGLRPTAWQPGPASCAPPAGCSAFHLARHPPTRCSHHEAEWGAGLAWCPRLPRPPQRLRTRGINTRRRIMRIHPSFPACRQQARPVGLNWTSASFPVTSSVRPGPRGQGR